MQWRNVFEDGGYVGGCWWVCWLQVEDFVGIQDVFWVQCLFDVVYQVDCIVVVFGDEEVYFVQVYVMFVCVGVVYGNCMCYDVLVDVFGFFQFFWFVWVDQQCDVEVVVVYVVDDGGGQLQCVGEQVFFGFYYVVGQV